MRVFIATIIAFAVASASAGAAAANFIKNGGFDLGPQPSYFATYAKGSTAIPGWVVTMFESRRDG